MRRKLGLHAKPLNAASLDGRDAVELPPRRRDRQVWGFDNSEQLREMLTQRREDWPSCRFRGHLRDGKSVSSNEIRIHHGPRRVRTSTCQRRRDAGRRQVGWVPGGPDVQVRQTDHRDVQPSIVVPSWTMSPLNECRPVCCGSCRFTDAHACRASGTVAVPDVREVDTGVVGPADRSSRDERIQIAGER
jgi:hypothetical protein